MLGLWNLDHRGCPGLSLRALRQYLLEGLLFLSRLWVEYHAQLFGPGWAYPVNGANAGWARNCHRVDRWAGGPGPS
jgi:hypothetical protein